MKANTVIIKISALQMRLNQCAFSGFGYLHKIGHTFFFWTKNYDFQDINLVNPENPEILSNFRA